MTVYKNAKIFTEDGLINGNIIVDNGRIISVSSGFTPFESDFVIDINNCYIFPGFIDVHTHLREPGFSYKETIKSGTAAAARGGYTAVFSMPNLNPVPDSHENLSKQIELIEKDAQIGVYPYGAITVGEKGEKLSDMEAMSERVIAFSDDGKGVQSSDLMKEAMKKAKKLDKIIVAHCEDDSLLKGGYIHDGEYAKRNGHKGICSESEWGQIKRDIEIVKETGCKYHICHVSTKESVELIRKAKKDGVDITAETAPHYLVLTEDDLKEEGRFKMNPPLRGSDDKTALIEGVKDGTIDMIATDHAPHSKDEKELGLEKSMMGVVGLETAFPILYTKLVKENIISLSNLIKLLNENPVKRFGVGNSIKEGASADFTVFDLDKRYTINPDEFLTKGRSTPFEGEEFFGKCIMTVYKGKVIYKFRED